MLDLKYWKSETAVADSVTMFPSILSLASLFIDQILKFFYQNDRWRELYKVQQAKKISRALCFCGWLSVKMSKFMPKILKLPGIL